jgi:hypothetical protein
MSWYSGNTETPRVTYAKVAIPLHGNGFVGSHVTLPSRELKILRYYVFVLVDYSAQSPLFLP